MTEIETETIETEQETPAESPENAPSTPDEPTEPDTFPRDYVERLRDESARYRQRAQRADDLAAALWGARVAASGRLADPTDLPMPEGADPLDPDAVATAVDDLLARKPHLASRRPRGDIGQGATASGEVVDLAALLRSNA